MNGLFVAAEFSLVKVRATQVDRLVKEGGTIGGALHVNYYNSHYDYSLRPAR